VHAYCNAYNQLTQPRVHLSCRDSTSTSNISESANKGDSIVFLQTQQSAKSFSSAATSRRQPILQADTLQAGQWQVAERVKYDNINQFSQKVELYRGR
jgi:hypothetical protein